MTRSSPPYEQMSPRSNGSPGYSPASYDMPSPDFGDSPGLESPEPASQEPGYNSWKGRTRKIPFVPPPRPRALTPHGFGDDDSDEQQKRPIALFQNSPWFKLPANVRRDIIRLTFGDQRLQIDLTLVEYEGSDEDFPGVEGTGPWIWSGKICSRDFEPSLGPMTRGGSNKGPWVDYYHATSAEGHIGVRGWLYSCRQNYAETIDILYSTNTFILSSDNIATHLPRLLLPQRLAVMTSLEIKWPLKEEDHLKTLLDLLSPPHFPSLKKLYVSLEYTGNDEPSQPLDSITGHLDQFVKNRPGLNECSFALPVELYEEIAAKCLQKESSWKRITYSEVWRSLNGSLNTIRLPYVDSYPSPPFHLGPKPGMGYWLLEGTDAPLNWRRNSNQLGFAGLDLWEDWGPVED
ncbi:hypothetical protein FSARC_11735 [Fusarium sarcochroum]|uniref:DUF7730 domain-containing protein n=1 Tax=Fusarium sarcochroum TaxID=1208366 RepID=A0A8H4TDD0_9HYPO|nr:hypothetical protein FSARC_11735 [Fusarium sarcochroum]